MTQKQAGLTPVFTTAAGCCLTPANWQEAGIKAGSYYLDALLMKPGMACLQKVAALSNYTGWQGITVLHLSLPAARNGVYHLRSIYDGSHVVISEEELFSLISLLQPDRLVLAAGILNHGNLPAWEELAKTSRLFALADESCPLYPDCFLGRYLQYNPDKPFSYFIQQIEHYAAFPLYVAGEFETEQWPQLTKANVWHVESDKPAREAMAGKVYSEEGYIDLLDNRQANQHQPISPDCHCPTCKQSLTKAYLHHLLAHTPLLCQRFLIQHNIHYFQMKLLGTSFTKG